MECNNTIVNRKGARKVNEIPNDVLTLLNQGQLESVNLTEWQAVNHKILLKNVLSSFGYEDKLDFMLIEMSKQQVVTGLKAIRLVGKLLEKVLADEDKEKMQELLAKCCHHVSDSVRCWAAFIKNNANPTLEERLSYIQPFAADHHFGVREIAWMSLREDLSNDIDKSVELLTEWANSNDENIRRFAVESIRPRGVWSKHNEILKQEPQKALPVLCILKADSSKYVQDSVGNWLNDASKSQPDWVLNLCEKWKKESPTKATERIIKKAKRTIIKNEQALK